MINNMMAIKGRLIGKHQPPFIIAELSGNHQQSYDLAIRMIDAAAEAGVDAIKLQTYTADSMTLDLSHNEFVINESNSLWKGESLHHLYQKAATPYEWHDGLFKHAQRLGLIAFSSPFDEAAVNFLETLDVPCYKVASFENNDLPLIRQIAKTGKPMIISTGMASLDELVETVAAAREAGCKQLTLLKCTSAYPSPAEDINLATMTDMADKFSCAVGLSDHTEGIEIALAAIAMGAQVIEKHFVLNREDGGVDAKFSLEPSELKTLVDQGKRIAKAIGQVNYGDTPSDNQARRYRRSVYISKDVLSGEVISKENIKVVRPGLGLAPKYYESLVGKIAVHDLTKGTPTSWDLFIESEK
jgi:N-acetylneuraminate synthase